jgi:hypothetical protein
MTLDRPRGRSNGSVSGRKVDEGGALRCRKRAGARVVNRNFCQQRTRCGRERRQGRPPRFRDALPEEMAPHLAAAKAGAGALAILEDPLSLGQWNEVVMRVSRLRLPAVYGYGEFAEAGVDDHDSRRRHHRIMSARLGALPRPSPGVDRDPGWASRVSSINHRD